MSEKGRKLYSEHPKLIPNYRNFIMKFFVPDYMERKRTCMTLLAEEKDGEAVEIATELIRRIDDWLAHMNEKMGITESGKLI
jgi:hypothetical protein